MSTPGTPRDEARLPQLRQLCQDRLAARKSVLRADLVERRGDLALLVDDERGADDAHVLPSVHRLLGPDTPGLGHRVLGVGEQREAELVLGVELALPRRRVGADPNYCGAELGEVLAM